MEEMVEAVRQYAADRSGGWSVLGGWSDGDIRRVLAGGGIGRVRPVSSAGGAVFRIAEVLDLPLASLPAGV